MNLSLKQAEDLKERLSQIPDPRMPRGKRHRKLSVLMIAICALLCSASNYAAIAQWTKSCTQNVLKRLGCRFNRKSGQYEYPSEPTIRRFLQGVDAEAADIAVYGWLQTLCGKGDALAIDGKTLKGARQQDGHTIHLLSAFLQQKGVVIAQCAVDHKTNEIPLNRGHWSIENSLHYVRDVTFREDHSTIRTSNAPQVFATLKNGIISILRLLGKTTITKSLRTMSYKSHLALKILRL